MKRTWLIHYLNIFLKQKWSDWMNNFDNTWSNKTFKGTVVNRTLSFLHGGALKVTLTIPLIKAYPYPHITPNYQLLLLPLLNTPYPLTESYIWINICLEKYRSKAFNTNLIANRTQSFRHILLIRKQSL